MRNRRVKIMLFENSYPYSQDVKLLKELKLAAWSAKHGEEKKIGIVVCDESTVEVFVTCLPAQFYRFIIKSFACIGGYISCIFI